MTLYVVVSVSLVLTLVVASYEGCELHAHDGLSALVFPHLIVVVYYYHSLALLLRSQQIS